ncbi:unnamed protein product [Rotaria sp. Silwood1]|nr:unnamed protein product [Rotaria sp. Silwood1]
MRSFNVRQAYENTVAPNDMKFCVHVTNVPSHVSGEQLAILFRSRVWDVLIRKSINADTDPFEAWILKLNTLADAQQLAISVKTIDGIDVQCNAEEEPLNEWTLCSGNRDGWCKHDNDCIYRHVICKYGDECMYDQCPFSHSTKRNIVPNPRYRSAGSNYTVKCQLEYDRAPIEQIPSSSSLDTNSYQQLSAIFASLAPGTNEINGMPSTWVWTNRRLGNKMSETYLVYPTKSTDNRLGAMKVYHNKSKLEEIRARRELLVLQALEKNAISTTAI